jgi:hypothetical protein
VKNRFQISPFKCNLQRYIAEAMHVTASAALPWWGCNKLNAQLLTHSLKATGFKLKGAWFQPFEAYKVISWFLAPLLSE